VLLDDGEDAEEKTSTTEPYGFPEGSAYVREIGVNTVYENDADENALSKALKEALKYLRKLKGEGNTILIATIVAKEGQYRNGLNISLDTDAGLLEFIRDLLKEEVAEGEVAPEVTDDEVAAFLKSLEITIVAFDALDTSDNPTAQSAGAVEIDGDIIVKGTKNIVLAGLYVVPSGTIEASDLESLTWYGTARDDTVGFKLSNISDAITIDSGAGDDTLVIDIEQAPTATVNLVEEPDEGFTADDYVKDILDVTDLDNPDSSKQTDAEKLQEAIKKAIEDNVSNGKTLSVTVNGGAGDDVITVTLRNSTGLTIKTTKDAQSGEETSTYTLSIDLGSTNLTIDGGAGDDEITVTGGVANVVATTTVKLVPAVLAYVNNNLATLAGSSYTAPVATITITADIGDDLVIVDTKVALATFGDTTATVAGDDGYDRLHLTGTLNDADTINEADRITGTADALKLAIKEALSLASKAVDFVIARVLDVLSSVSVEARTDRLANKRTVEVEGTAAGSGSEAQSFTDYVLKLPDDQNDVNFVSNYTIPADLLLANFIVKGETLVVQQLSAAGLNVFIEGRDILISGSVTGRNISIVATATDLALFDGDIASFANNVASTDALTFDADVSLYGANAEAKVVIAATAVLTATECIYILATCTQEKPNLPALLVDKTDANFFDLKLGRTTIEILGRLIAGGTIWIKAVTTVETESSNGKLAVAIPFALAAAATESRITVGGNARIEAGASVHLIAQSKISLKSEATGGKIPISIALNVAEIETHVLVKDNAVIITGSRALIKAQSDLKASASVSGKNPSADEQRPKSATVAVNVLIQETSATVTGNASITTGAALDVISISTQRATAVSIVLPEAKADTTASTSDSSSIMSKALDLVKSKGSELLSSGSSSSGGSSGSGGQEDEESSTFSKANEKTTGDKAPDKQAEDASSQAGSGDTSYSQASGAFAVSYVSNTNTALVDTHGIVQAGGALQVKAEGYINALTRADGSLYEAPKAAEDATPAEEPKNALGAAVAVAVYDLDNVARLIGYGNVTSQGLTVTALSPSNASVVIAKSGHMPTTDATEIGIAGAVAVNIVSITNSAVIAAGSYNLTGGSVDVISSGRGFFSTVADASGTRTTPEKPATDVKKPEKPKPAEGTEAEETESVGVGAGIAVAVTGIDALAQIEDGVIFNLADGVELDSVTVRASFEATEQVYAAAGASGGTAIVPVLALVVSGVSVEALVGATPISGSGAGDFLVVSGDVVVDADAKVTRELTADAAATGEGVGLGAAFAIAIINDSAYASLGRNVRSRGNVRIDARSASKLKETAKASATGAEPESSPTAGKADGGDATAGKTQEETEAVASDSDDSHLPTPDEGETDVDKATADRFSKEGAADKFADKNTDTAKDLADKVDTKNVNSDAVNDLTTDRQQAQTSEGNVQVAAAFVLNIQKNTVQVEIVDGLVIEAEGSVEVRGHIDTDAVISADASATNSIDGVGVAVALNIVSYKNVAYLGDSTIKAASLLVEADIIEFQDAKALEAALKALVDYIVETSGVEGFIDIVLATRDGSDTLDSLVAAALATAPADSIPTDATELAAAKQEIKDAVIKGITDKLKGGEVTNVSGSVLEALAETVIQNILKTLADEDFITKLLKAEGTATAPLDAILTGALIKTALATDENLRTAVTLELAARFGANSESNGAGNKISTSAISGVGAANVGVAGAVAITILNGKTEASIANSASRTSDDLVITGDAVVRANSVDKVYTTATAATDKKGMAQKNKNGTGSSEGGSSVGVGASAAVSIVGLAVNAILGVNRDLAAATLAVVATATNEVETTAVAGTDPIARREEARAKAEAAGEDKEKTNNTTTKDIAVDASVAVNIIDIEVNALVAVGTFISTTGGDTIETGVTLADGITPETANLLVKASQHGKTTTAASAFAEGNKTAVGAAIALNLAYSTATASFLGTGEVAGFAKLIASAYTEDVVKALATVTGASLDRYFDYLTKIQRMLSFDSLSNSGSSGDSTDAAVTDGSLNSKITDEVNKKVDPVTNEESADGNGGVKEATAGAPLQKTLLDKLNVTTPAKPDSTDATDTASTEGDTPAASPTTDDSAKNSQTINVAAAVAVNITKHVATAVINGILTAQKIAVEAQNNANYRTLATGAAVTPGQNNANNISAAVAVTVNNNEANALLAGTIIARGDGTNSDTYNGAIDVTATQTQNLEKPYKGLLAAQALAGSVAGSGGKIGLAGAVAVLVAQTKTIAALAPAATVTGGVITINATDTSKYAVRAGGITVTGASVGIGAAFALIYARSTTWALVGDGASILADSLTVNAERKEVTFDDYDFPLDTKTLFTSGSSVADGDKGLIHVNISTDGDGTTGLEFNLEDTQNLLELVDALNFLASVNYYLEAIAGSVVNGEGSGSAVAGSIAMGFIYNSTQALIGKNVTVVLRDGGTAAVTAASKATIRIIGGAIGFTTGSAAVGINVAALYDDDYVRAQIGEGSRVTAPAGITVEARSGRDVWAITIAAAATTGTGAGVGGNLNVILTGVGVAKLHDSANDTPAAKTIAQVADDVVLNAANGDVRIAAFNDADLLLIAASLAFASSSVAVGGTIAFIYTQNEVAAKVGDRVRIDAASITIEAQNDERLLEILASLSASNGSAGVAATLGVLIAKSTALASVGNYAILTATAGDIIVRALGDVWQLVIMPSIAISTASTAVGATINVLVFERTTRATVGDYSELTATQGNIIIQAAATNWALLISFAGGFASGTSISGVIAVIVGRNITTASLGDHSTATAVGSVAVLADIESNLYAAAGNIAAGAGNSIGATISIIVEENVVEARIGDYTDVTGLADASIAPVVVPAEPSASNRKINREMRGVIVSALAYSQLLMLSVSGGVGGGSVAVAGAVNTLVQKNTVRAKIGAHAAINTTVVRTANGEIAQVVSENGNGSDQDVIVEAQDASELYDIAGGLAAASSAGVGASAVVVVISKEVTAAIENGAAVYARRDVAVRATNSDTIVIVSINFAGGGTAGVGVGISALVFENSTNASLGGTVKAGRDIIVAATAHTNLYNNALAGSVGGTAGVTPVAAVTWFDGKTIAQILSGARLIAGGAVKLTASSKEFIETAGVGISIGGTAAISGTILLVLTGIETIARTGDDVTIDAASVEVRAEDDYVLIGVAASIALAGTAAVGVTALISLIHNTVSAIVGARNTIITRTGDVVVSASSNRDITEVAGTVAVGAGAAGVGVTLMVAIVGGKLTQDVADDLTGTSPNQDNGSFDPNFFMDTAHAQAAGPAKGSIANRKDGLSESLEGDGTRQADTTVGSDDFDADGGYRSDDYTDSTTNEEPGKDQTYADDGNADYQNAAQVGSTKPNYVRDLEPPRDATTAIIGQDTTINSAGDIIVEANDNLLADLITATAAVGLYAGVGVGVTVAVLYSNVFAIVAAGADLQAVGNVRVEAHAGSNPQDVAIDEANRELLEDALEADDNELPAIDLSRRSIRAVAGVVGVGFVGVSATASVVLVYSNVVASVAGTISKAASVTVEASSNYPNVLAVTLAVGGGVVGITASLALVIFDATVEASIKGYAVIGAEGTSQVGDITVATKVTNTAVAVATALAAGLVAVNGGVAVVVNHTAVDTFIDENIRIYSNGTVTVANTSSIDGLAFVIGAAAGGVAVNLSAAVVVLGTSIRTWIGVDPAVASHTANGSVKANDVVILNRVNSNSASGILSVAAGFVSVGGSLLLTFNRINALAGISRMNVEATNDITVDAFLDATATARFIGAAVGAIAIGITVSYVQLRSVNEAFIDVTGVTVKAAGNIAVRAGTLTDTNETTAAALAVAGNVGAIAVGINVAIADNNSKNTARVTGDTAGTLQAAGALTVLAVGTMKATATIYGVTAAAIAVAADFALALLRGVQEAKIDSGRVVVANGLTVQSHLNQDVEYSAAAELKTGSGALISLTVSVAVAQGRSVSRALLTPHALNVGGTVKVGSYGKAGTKATVTNLGGAALVAKLIFGLAYAQGTFEAIIEMNNGSSFNGNDITVEVNYQAHTLADVTPSAGGVSASLATVQGTLAIATTATTALAVLRGPGTVTAHTIEVTAIGDVQAHALIRTPTFSVNGRSVVANIVYANLEALQIARIVDLTLEAVSVTVASELNSNNQTGAWAEMGGTGSGGVYLNGLSAQANTATALANATSRARIERVNLTVAQDITVRSSGSTVAVATVLGGSGVSVVGIGVNVMYARAEGMFEALIDTAGTTIHANNVAVLVQYLAQANAVSKQPSGGVSVSVISINSNIAQATVGVNAIAAITGNGLLIAAGNVTVQTVGDARAEAQIPGVNVTISGARVAVNVVTATVAAVQEAYLRDATVKASALNIQARFNKDRTDGGAYATVGSNGGANVSILDGQVSSATAAMSATVRAYVRGGNLEIDNALSVTVDAVSYAFADIIAASTNVSLVNATLLVTSANAAGIFEAIIGYGSSPTNVKAGSVTILTTYRADSLAEVGPAGGLSGSVQAIAANVNSANAQTTVTARAGFAGTGSSIISGNLVVRVTGNGTATARGRTYNITVSGVRVAINEVYATLNATQEAYVTMDRAVVNGVTLAGSLVVGDTLTVDSQFGADGNRGTALATVGGSAGGSVSLLSATTNKAVARSQVKNSAYLSGTNITALRADVRATTWSEANAKSQAALSVSVATRGNLEANAYAQDDTSAFIANDTQLTVGQTLALTARNDTKATAFTGSPGNAAVIGSSSAKAVAGVGESGRREQAQAYIGDGAVVTTGGNLTMSAYNHGVARSYSERGSAANISLGNVSNSQIPTSSWYNTAVWIGSGAVLTVGGNLTLRSEDRTEAESIAIDRSIGFLLNASNMRGNNSINTINTVTIKEGAHIFATGNIVIEAVSNAIMVAKTENQSGGFVSGSQVHASNSLTRTIAVTVQSGAYLESDYGNITLQVLAGTGDDIRTRAYISSGGFVAISDAYAQSDITTNATLTVERGATIKDTFGAVKLLVDASEGYVEVYAFSKCGGVGVNPEAHATNNLWLTGRINIGTAGNGTATIVARTIDIRTTMSQLGIVAKAEAQGRGLGVNSQAYATANIHEVVLETNVSNAELRGYDWIVITTTASPSWRDNHILVDAYGYLGAFAGRAQGHANLLGSIASRTTLTEVVIFSGDVTVDAQTPALRTTSTGHVKRQGIASKSTTSRNDVNSHQSRSLVLNNVYFYLGKGAAGIVIDIDEAGVARTVGLPDPSIIAKSDATHTITIGDIANAQAGKLALGSTGSTNWWVFGQDLLYEVTIINRSDYDLSLRSITVQNTNYVAHSVTVGGRIVYPTIYRNQRGWPTVRVETRTIAGLHIGGLIANRYGDVEFVWTGEDGGALTNVSSLVLIGSSERVAPIWANRLVVEGATTIGTATNPLAVWLFEKLTVPPQQPPTAAILPQTLVAPTANFIAEGDVYLTLTPSVFIEQTSFENFDPDTTAYDTGFLIERILTNGDVFLDLKITQRIYGLADSGTINIPVPGTLQYVSGVLRGLVNDVILDRAALEHYLMGYDRFEDIYYYRLPNGVELWIASDGTLLRVIEYVAGNPIETVLGRYQYQYDSDNDIYTLTLDNGIIFDLTHGWITLIEGTSIEVLLETIDIDWFMELVASGDFLFVYYVPVERWIDDDYGYQIEYLEHEVRLIAWYDDSNKHYYILEERIPTGDALRDAAEKNLNDVDAPVYFVIVVDTVTGTLAAYELDQLLSSPTGVSSKVSETIFNYVTNGSGVPLTIYQDGTYWYFIEGNGAFDIGVSQPVYNFTNFGGTGIHAQYNEAGAGTWTFTYNGTTVVVPVIVNAGVFSIDAGFYTGSDTNILALIELLRGLYWTMQKGEEAYSNSATSGVAKRTYIGELPIYQPYTWEQIGLKSYWYDLTFWELNPVSLLVTPVMVDDGTDDHNLIFDHYQVIPYLKNVDEDDPDSAPVPYSTITFDGPIENIHANPTMLPSAITGGTAELGWKVDGELYVSIHVDADGIFDGFGAVILALPGITIRYDGTNYESHTVRLTNANDSDGTSNSMEVTLFAGQLVEQMVEIELVTDTLAVDVQGNYYVFTGDNPRDITQVQDSANWRAVSQSDVAIETVTGGQVTLPDGSQITDGSVYAPGFTNIVTIKRTTVTDNGITWIIEEIDWFIEDQDHNQVLQYHQVRLEMSYGTKRLIIDSEGRITVVGEPETLRVVPLSGGTVWLGNVSGVNIQVNAEQGVTVRDGRGRPNTSITAPNLYAAGTPVLDIDGDQVFDANGDPLFIGGNLLLIGDTNSSFGLSGEPLHVIIDGVLTLRNPTAIDGQPFVADAWLEVDEGNLIFNALTLINDATLWINNQNGDIVFNRIEAYNSAVTLKANQGYVRMAADTGYLWADATSTITLGAKQDIGSASRPLVVDIPQTNTLYIDFAYNWYIDGVELVGDAREREKPQQPRVEGRDKDGNWIIGYYLGEAGSETIYVSLPWQTPEELAQWIVDSLDRDAWRALLTDDVLASLIEQGFFDAESLAALLCDETFTVTDLERLLGDLTDDDRFNILGAMLGVVLDNPYLVYIPDAVAAEWLNSIVVAQPNLDPVLVDELTQGLEALLLAGGLTAEEAQALNDEGLAAVVAWVYANVTADQWRVLLNAQVLAALIELGGVSDEDLADLLCDETFTAADLSALLADTNDVDRYLTVGLLLATVLGNPDLVYVTDEQAQAWLVGAIEIDAIVSLGDILASLLTPEDIAALIERTWDDADYDANNLPPAPPARSLTIDVGASEGAGWVNNEGSIFVTQHTGDLTAGRFYSHQGDVVLEAVAGNILAVAGTLEANVDAVEIVLRASGSVGTPTTPLVTEQRSAVDTQVGLIAKPVVRNDGTYEEVVVVRTTVVDANGDVVDLWALDTVVRYFWILIEDASAATRLDVNAGGSAFIKELTGDVGLGIVNTGGDFELNAPGDILDTRDTSEIAPNITAGGNVTLVSDTGAVGTDENFIETDVGGTLFATAPGDIHIDDRGELVLVADSSQGQIYARSIADLILSNSNDSDLVIGFVLAGGDVVIIGGGNVLAGDKKDEEVYVRGGSIAVVAGGTIGADDKPLLLDTDFAHGGTLIAVADGNLWIDEATGDLRVDVVFSGGDTTLTVPGSLIDVDDTGRAALAQELQQRYNEIQNAIDGLLILAEILREYLDGGRFAADQGYTSIAQAVAVLTAAADAALAAYNQAVIDLANAQIERDDAEAAWDDAQIAWDVAQTARDAAQTARDAAEAIRDAAVTEDERALAEEALVAAEEELARAEEALVAADEALVAADEALAAANAAFIDAVEREADALAASIAAEAAYDNFIAAYQAVLAQISDLLAEAANLQVTIADPLQQAAAAAAAALANTPASLTSGGDMTLVVGGSIGSDTNDLGVRVGGILDVTIGDITQDGVWLESNGSLIFAPIVADVVSITATGDINTSTPGQTAITARTTELHAIDGDVGTRTAPLILDTTTVTASGNGVYLHNLRTLIVDSIVADDLTLIVDGDLIAGDAGINSYDGRPNPNIEAGTARIDATGSIGTPAASLVTNIDRLSATAGGGIVLDNQSRTLVVDGITAGGDVIIRAAGSITGGVITAPTLIIAAIGTIGARGSDLLIYVTGLVQLTSAYGWIYFHNLYTPPVPNPTPNPIGWRYWPYYDDEEEEAEVSVAVTTVRPVQPGNSTPPKDTTTAITPPVVPLSNFWSSLFATWWLYLIIVLVALAIFFLIFWKRRKKEEE